MNSLLPDVVDVNSRRTFYLHHNLEGSKRAVLMLHGFMSNSSSLGELAEGLALPKDTALLLPDLPGFGGSEDLEGEANLQKYVAWVPEFLRTVAPDIQDITLVGYSFGGYIAGLLAVQQSTSIARLVIVTPVVQLARPVLFYGNGFTSIAQISQRAAHRLYEWQPQFDLTTLYISRHRKRDQILDLVRRRREDLRSSRPEVALALVSDLRTVDLRRVAGHIQAPVSIVLAGKDRVAVNDATMELASKLVVPYETILLEEAGHLVPMEHPEVLIESLNGRLFPAQTTAL